MPMSLGPSSFDSNGSAGFQGVTMGAAGGAAAAGGTAALSATGVGLLAVAALQVWSGFQQAEMIREQAKLQAKINELNAGFAEQDAFEAEAMGYTEAARYQSVIDATIGDQKVAFASQDVNVTSGTAAAVQKESRFTGYLNQLELQKQGRERAQGFKNEARNIRFGSAMQRSQSAIDASGAERNAVIGGLTTGISGYSRK